MWWVHARLYLCGCLWEKKEREETDNKEHSYNILSCHQLLPKSSKLQNKQIYHSRHNTADNDNKDNNNINQKKTNKSIHKTNVTTKELKWTQNDKYFEKLSVIVIS